MDFKYKYIKYKNKYNKLKENYNILLGGASQEISLEDKILKASINNVYLLRYLESDVTRLLEEIDTDRTDFELDNKPTRKFFHDTFTTSVTSLKKGILSGNFKLVSGTGVRDKFKTLLQNTKAILDKHRCDIQFGENPDILKQTLTTQDLDILIMGFNKIVKKGSIDNSYRLHFERYMLPHLRNNSPDNFLQLKDILMSITVGINPLFILSGTNLFELEFNPQLENIQWCLLRLILFLLDLRKNTVEGDKCLANNYGCFGYFNRQIKQCKELYLLLGHGRTNDTVITIPENFNLVTFTRVGDAHRSFFSDIFLLTLFDNKSEYKGKNFDQILRVLASPVFGIKEFLGMDFFHHPPNCNISDITFNFLIGTKNERTFDFQKSGIYQYGNTDIKLSIFDSKSVKMQTKALELEDIKPYISWAISGDSFINRKTQKELYRLILGEEKFNLSDLFKFYKDGGTFFLPICRNCDDSPVKNRLRRGSIDQQALFNYDFNSLLEDKTLNIKNVEAIIKILIKSIYRMILMYTSSSTSLKKLVFINKLIERTIDFCKKYKDIMSENYKDYNLHLELLEIFLQIQQGKGSQYDFIKHLLDRL